MTDPDLLSVAADKNYGWQVTFAGMGINLALGVLYTWSVIADGVPKEWDWNQSDKAWPYAIACLVFCLTMVPAGRMQDRLGPRLVASIGGLLVGAGMIGASFTTSLMGFVIGFGVFAGAGIGFGYASTTPAAVKWFPPAKTGMIAGIVVSGFGLASVYAAPLARWLTANYGVQVMMRVFGVAFVIVVVGLAQFLKAPHRVMQLVRGYGRAGEIKAEKAGLRVKKEDFTPSEMLRTWQFYALWFMYACGAGAGLMIISVAMKLGKGQTIGTMGAGTIMVVTLAIGNGAGRIVAGMLSDRIGRRLTMAIFFLLQAVMVILLAVSGTIAWLGSGLALAIGAAMVGASYGANLAVFPSATKDYYGIKSFGVNYGLVFTAWGFGGFLLSKLAGSVYDWTGRFHFAYYTSAVLLVLAAAMAFVVKAPQHHVEAADTIEA